MFSLSIFSVEGNIIKSSYFLVSPSNTGGKDSSVKRIFPENLIIIQAPAFRDGRGLKRPNKLSYLQLLSKNYTARSRNHKIITDAYKIYYV